MSSPPPSRRALGALVVLAAVLLGVGACSGSGGAGGGDSGTTVTTPVPELQFAYSDPSQPIGVDIGRRFSIMLPADPAHGWRWVVEPVDTRFLAPLGSEFRDDPTLLALATTTTTTAPPEETTTTTARPGATTTEAPPTTTTEPPSTTSTTAPGPLVQIVSYAGRAAGTTTVTLRYERIGTGSDDDTAAQTLVFDVVVGTVVPETTETTEAPPA